MCHPFIFFRFILKKDVLWLPSSAKTPVVRVGLLSLHLVQVLLHTRCGANLAIDNLTHNQSCFILC